MKHNINSKTKNFLFIAMFLIAFTILFYQVVSNIGSIVITISDVFKFLTGLLLPFLLGCFIAFILNPLLNYVETSIFMPMFKTKKKTKGIRILSLFLVYMVAISFIAIIIVYMVPTVKDSLEEFILKLPDAIVKAEEFLEQYDLTLTIDTQKGLMDSINAIVKNPSSVLAVVSGVVSVTLNILNVLIAIIISFYVLEDKERLLKGCKRLSVTFLSKKVSGDLIGFCRIVNKVFNKFIVGKTIDSLIIGILSYIGFVLLGVKYAILFAVIVGVTNMIPYFGPFIGGIPVVILVFLYEPSKAIPVGIFIFLLQQFDGYILGPKLVGDVVGLKPIWVIFSILIGGALWGALGMFIAVPTFAVIQELFEAFVDRKYKKKLVRQGEI